MSDDLIADGPPRGWCPECDGPSRCAPGTCCGVGAPEAVRELHEALDDLQGLAHRLGFCCYAAALDPHSPCPWHAEAAAPPQAPITAEDVRAAEDSWSALGAAGRVDSILSHHKDRYGHMADYLNRRGERT